MLIVNHDLFNELTVVAKQVYQLLLHITTRINPISCDEMTIQIKPEDGFGNGNPLAETVRKHISDETRCYFSIGTSVGRNPPLATNTLLENTNGVPRPPPRGSEHRISVLSGAAACYFY